MPRSEQGKANKSKYDMKYKAEHYKRVPLNLTHDKYNEVKAAAESNNESVNGYIKKAIDLRLENDK